MATQAIPAKNTAPVRGTSIKRQRTVVDVITYILLGLGAAIVLVPFWWMIKTSLTAETRLFQFPPQFFPDPVVWRNYLEAWNALPVSFTRFTANTIFITVLAALWRTASRASASRGAISCSS
jgi:multiple sugar transport system permease protein